MASGAWAAFYDMDLSIPRDLAVAMFDDLPLLQFARPRFTRVGNSPAALARHAAAMLLERIGGAYSGPARTEVIPCRLHVLDTA
jgi:DNA-binding LacI/PurR family transcriptional regulator